MKHRIRTMVAAGLAAGMIASIPAQGQAPQIGQLDPDGNGLYDNQERKVLLDTLAAAWPELEGPFDHDGDGQVTIEEQTQGRHPITTLDATSLLASGLEVPWAIDIFPEWITTAYLQEDVEQGEVSDHLPRGNRRRNATQESSSLRPRRAADRGGVTFAENSGQHLTAEGYRAARWDYRWTLFTFRIDANTGSGKQTVLLDLNSGKESSRSSPKVWFNKDTGLHVQYLGLNKGGIDKRVLTASNVVADGETWNVLVCGIRFGQMYASVNGVELTSERPQPPRFSGELPPRDGVVTYLGDTSKTNMAWAYDALVFGMTEPSEAMVRKLTGWAAHRAGSQGILPEDHPYRATRPIVDREDFPYRYVHDAEKGDAWGATLRRPEKTANTGGPRVEPQGWERVFFDDFNERRVANSGSGEAEVWAAPGWNTSVGMAATLLTPTQKPDVYLHDAEKGLMTLTLDQRNDGRWVGSAMYTINDLGHGYTWAGPKIFRIRVKFPKTAPEDLATGLFPAFWSYSTDFLFWRTTNRIENDWAEWEGKNPWWLNGLSTHVHYSHFRNNIFAKRAESYKRFKVWGSEMTEEKTNIPGGIYVWDGQFHTWEWIVDEDTTYINITAPDQNGEERWYELCRVPTAPTYLEALDLQVNYALKNTGSPKDGERQDMIIDFIEVLQKTDRLAEVPEPFTALPKLSGTVEAGETITCEPNVEGVKDIRYFWFADAVPLTWGPDSTYTVTEADAGKEIRCMVKAVGALDQPEAWSEPLR